MLLLIISELQILSQDDSLTSVESLLYSKTLEKCPVSVYDTTGNN